RDVENRERLGVMEALRERHAVMRVVHPLLRQGVADAEIDPAEDLTVQASWIDHGADVGDGEVVDEMRLARLEIDLDLRESGDERPGVAVARIRVLRDAHQAEAGERGRRSL